MLNMIINADDCGLSKDVNEVIGQAITRNKITSTTIMANMDDFDGAIRLYNEYHDTISFGVHLNLTEGEPLLFSQELLDIGFYKEVNGRFYFNGKPFQNRFLNHKCEGAIKKELMAQVAKIKDYGVKLSHIDSHHHIHKSVFMMRILPDICRSTGLYKVRNVHNYMPLRKDTIIRNAWTFFYKFRLPSIIFTDWFCSFSDYLQLCGKRLYEDNDSIELMCHPGGIYKEEDKNLFMIDAERDWGVRLINYNQIER